MNNMDINQLYSTRRTGKDSPTTAIDPRTEFQRDFDRIIFSSSFRRLQNKTQVFPLPGSVFVHNRLTHSLEVASVGRSLGNLTGDFIAQQYASKMTEESKQFYKHSLYNVISSACLCHDIGNPAFGHSGEDAIATFFLRNEHSLKDKFSDKQWSDFIHFEGNANAIRILTQQQNGKSEGGLQLTFATLASIAKYPCASIARKKGILHRKKYGFFQAEENIFRKIAASTSMLQESEEPLIFLRHPFVWLVEAADDICYNIIDLEDAHRLKIISHPDCKEILLNLIKDIETRPAEISKVEQQLTAITDKNDKISYLRAKSISALIVRCAAIYQGNFDSILAGTHTTPLLEAIEKDCKALTTINEYSVANIYNHHSVVEIENAGYNVMYELLSHFIWPVIKPKEERRKYEAQALKLVPQQFLYEDGDDYQRVLGILDYVSGMTDNYATDLYRKIKGIDIGMTI